MVFGVALLRKSVARMIEKPLLILTFHLCSRKKIQFPPLDFFLIADFTSTTMLNDIEKYSSVSSILLLEIYAVRKIIWEVIIQYGGFILSS